MVLAGGGVCSQKMILVEFGEVFELMFFFQRQVLEKESKAGLQSKDHVSLVPEILAPGRVEKWSDFSV